MCVLYEFHWCFPGFSLSELQFGGSNGGRGGLEGDMPLGPADTVLHRCCSCCVFGRFDLAALCGCRTLNFCLFVLWLQVDTGCQPSSVGVNKPIVAPFLTPLFWSLVVWEV